MKIEVNVNVPNKIQKGRKMSYRMIMCFPALDVVLSGEAENAVIRCENQKEYMATYRAVTMHVKNHKLGLRVCGRKPDVYILPKVGE